MCAGRFARRVSRYFVLRGFFLYSYKKEGSTGADRVYFIQGSFVKENDQFARDGYYGLHIIDPDVTGEKENSSNVRVRGDDFKCKTVPIQ